VLLHLTREDDMGSVPGGVLSLTMTARDVSCGAQV
jgi:hypothetical protein